MQGREEREVVSLDLGYESGDEKGKREREK